MLDLRSTTVITTSRHFYRSSIIFLQSFAPLFFLNLPRSPFPRTSTRSFPRRLPGHNCFVYMLSSFLRIMRPHWILWFLTWYSIGVVVSVSSIWNNSERNLFPRVSPYKPTTDQRRLKPTAFSKIATRIYYYYNIMFFVIFTNRYNILRRRECGTTTRDMAGDKYTVFFFAEKMLFDEQWVREKENRIYVIIYIFIFWKKSSKNKKINLYTNRVEE